MVRQTRHDVCGKLARWLDSGDNSRNRIPGPKKDHRGVVLSREDAESTFPTSRSRETKPAINRPLGRFQILWIIPFSFSILSSNEAFLSRVEVVASASLIANGSCPMQQRHKGISRALAAWVFLFLLFRFFNGSLLPLSLLPQRLQSHEQLSVILISSLTWRAWR